MEGKVNASKVIFLRYLVFEINHLHPYLQLSFTNLLFTNFSIF